MRLYLIVFIVFLLVGSSTIAQTNDNIIYLKAVVLENGDTLPNITLKEIKVFPVKTFKNEKERRRYTKLMYNVKKAYPFAIIAREELRIMNDSLVNIRTERGRKKYIKEYEKNMFDRYEADLRKLTFSQGKILLKLVYREVGNTSYYLVKEYRGDVSAVFWQGIARIFGSNLKSVYDPTGEDAEIEIIVQMIEAGYI